MTRTPPATGVLAALSQEWTATYKAAGSPLFVPDDMNDLTSAIVLLCGEIRNASPLDIACVLRPVHLLPAPESFPDRAAFSLALAVLAPEESRFTSVVALALSHGSSSVRLWMFKNAWLIRHRLSAADFEEALLSNVEKTLGHWELSLALCRALHTEASFWRAVGEYRALEMPEQYNSRVAAAKEQAAWQEPQLFADYEHRVRGFLATWAGELQPRRENGRTTQDEAAVHPAMTATMPTLFRTLSSKTIAELVRGARNSVCYAGPGIQMEPARAIADAAGRLRAEMLTVSVDFDERVMRMGFGSVEAIAALRAAGVAVHHSPGLRTALLVVDDEGFIFTPTPLYLEPEPSDTQAPNALRLSREQQTEALARLSMGAKAIAVARAETGEEKSRLSALPIDMSSTRVGDVQLRQVEQRLAEVPPVPFDLARQVRVFEPYLQYVEMSLSGAAIQRHRLAIPPEIQRLGGSKDLEGRLRTTFDLIERAGKLSSKGLEDELNDIRRNFTPSLGKDHGRVVLKAAKPHLMKRLEEFRANLAAHQKTVEAELQKNLNKSRTEIVEYYLPRVVQNPPDSLLGQLFASKPSKKDAQRWLEQAMDRVFPTANDLVQAMRLDVYFKDVTFETLNEPDFLESIKKAFPNIDWDKTYEEFKAAGESAQKRAQA